MLFERFLSVMDEIKKYHTDFLFASPSFLTGTGSVFNMWGNYFIFNYSPTTQKADEKAIRNDWGMIGCDLLEALDLTLPQKSKLPKKATQLSFHEWD